MHKTLYNSSYVANTKCSKHQGYITQVSSSGSSLSSSSTFIASCLSLSSSSSSLSLSSCPPLTNMPSSFFAKPILLKIFPAPMGSPTPTKLMVGFDKGF
ncbi:hypothetical protein M9H77_27454 [Catharanthus roseus]|uniref:Uncharacterized protein n=1 Tax=Catharanthus roseus TaxID=4058 RepID=A0ACC0AD40_CATRO|nr:hypothetical protein M9H77_27454 [Catharanthus roseus]